MAGLSHDVHRKGYEPVTESELAAWTGPSSATEQEKQDRTERMIRDAIAAHQPFKDVSLSIYTKGSYPNNTNVRTESDVDVAVQCNDCTYWEEAAEGAHPSTSTYSGIWTPAKLRTEVGAALEAKFPGAVDSSGKKAFRVNSTSARVDADVVPCFDYRYYFSAASYRAGAKILRKDGTAVVNYAQQQLDQGRAKNNQTNTSYKKVVRILKRTALSIAATNGSDAPPSFFIESLVFNVPNTVLVQSSWTDRTKGALFHIWESLDGAEPDDDENRWVEANGAKFLFFWGQPWTRSDGRSFAAAAWEHLGFGT